MKRKVFWVLGILLVIIFYGVIFSRPVNEYASLIEEGPVVELINSLTAPFIGLIGAVLVYLSLIEQVRANKIQSQALNEQRELDLLYKLYEELKSDLEKIQSEYGPRFEQTSILDSMMNYMLGDKPSPYEELNNYVIYIFNQFVFLGKRISRTKYLNDSEVVYLIEKTVRLYDLYFRVYYDRFFSKLFTHESITIFKTSFQKVQELIVELERIHETKKGDIVKKAKS